MTERSTVEILRAARERISDPERWGKGSFAYSKQGRPTSPWLDAAACWCIRGAVYCECGSASTKAAQRAQAFLAEAIEQLDFEVPDNAEPIAWVNDSGTHEDVLALCDKAISLAEEASC